MKKILAISFLLFGLTWAVFAQASDRFQVSTTGEKFLYVTETLQKEKLRWIVRVTAVGKDEFPVQNLADFQKLADALTSKVFPNLALTYQMPTARNLVIIVNKPSKTFWFDWKVLEATMEEALKVYVVRSEIFEAKFMDSNFYSYYHKGPWFVFEPKSVLSTLVATSNEFVQNVSIVQDGDFLSIIIYTPDVIQRIKIRMDKEKPALETIDWQANGSPKQSVVEKADLWGKYLHKYAGDLPASMQSFLTPEVVTAISKAADSKKEK
jgi:hypothetical protein